MFAVRSKVRGSSYLPSGPCCSCSWFSGPRDGRSTDSSLSAPACCSDTEGWSSWSTGRRAHEKKSAGVTQRPEETRGFPWRFHRREAYRVAQVLQTHQTMRTLALLKKKNKETFSSTDSKPFRKNCTFTATFLLTFEHYPHDSSDTHLFDAAHTTKSKLRNAARQSYKFNYW